MLRPAWIEFSWQLPLVKKSLPVVKKKLLKDAQCLSCISYIQLGFKYCILDFTATINQSDAFNQSTN